MAPFWAAPTRSGSRGGCSKEAPVRGRTLPVGRGSVEVVLRSKGELKARKFTRIHSEVEMEAKIIQLAKEGETVKAGDVLVKLDPTELQQVVVNLINNGVYAISGSGEIEVAASQKGREVLVSVRDTGSGIAHEDIERIFLPFFSTKPVGKGTGLGLSVCYGIVQGWGGVIEAESERGIGTTITIRLPADTAGDVKT